MPFQLGHINTIYVNVFLPSIKQVFDSCIYGRTISGKTMLFINIFLQKARTISHSRLLLCNNCHLHIFSVLCSI